MTGTSQKFWNKNYILVAVSCCLSSVTNSISSSLLPVVLDDLGAKPDFIGLMITVMTVVGLVTRLVIAPFVDRIDRRKMLIFGTAIFTLNALGFCFTKDITMLFLLRVVMGFTQGIYFPAPQTYISDVAPDDRLVDAFGYFGIACSLAFAFTPTFALKIYNTFGSTWLFTVSVLASVIALILTLFMDKTVGRVKAPADLPKEKADPSAKIGLAFLILILVPSIGNCLLATGSSSISSFLTNCGLERGIQRISWFFIAQHLSMIGIRLVLGRIVNKVSSKLCIWVGIFCTAAGLILIAFSYSLIPMLLSAVLCGVGSTVVGQLLQVQILRSVPENRKGVATNIWMLSSDIGNGIGSYAWGLLSSVYTYGVAFFASGITALLSLIPQVFVNRLFYKRKS